MQLKEVTRRYAALVADRKMLYMGDNLSKLLLACHAEGPTWHRYHVIDVPGKQYRVFGIHPEEELRKMDMYADPSRPKCNVFCATLQMTPEVAATVTHETFVNNEYGNNWKSDPHAGNCEVPADWEIKDIG